MTTQEMQQRVTESEREIAAMKQHILQLEQRFSCQPIPDDCTEYGGAVFQKKTGGGYREAIFCLVCGSPMSPLAARTHFVCRCGHFASFPGKTISEIVKDIPTR